MCPRRCTSNNFSVAWEFDIRRAFDTSISAPSATYLRHPQASNMASQAQYVALARTLPPRLTRFFARYAPPGATSVGSSISPLPSSAEILPVSSPLDPTAALPAHDVPTGPSWENPFRSTKSPITGRWHDPKFSLRRQADLVKLAREHGVEELLPFTMKKTGERARAREENGLRVKGTGIGQQVKGKAWERTMKGRYVEFIYPAEFLAGPSVA